MKSKGHPIRIERSVVESEQITLQATPDPAKAINTEKLAMVGLRRISGASNSAEVWGILQGDSVYTRMHTSSGTPISVNLSLGLIALDPAVYIASHIQLLASDAVVRVGGKG